MKDLLLTADGDLLIDDNGDIAITDSAVQAVKIRIQWFLAEWKFWPAVGIPYFEEILRKKPDAGLIAILIREAAMEVEGVLDVKDIDIKINAATRSAAITFTLVTEEGVYREAVEVSGIRAN